MLQIFFAKELVVRLGSTKTYLQQVSIAVEQEHPGPPNF